MTFVSNLLLYLAILLPIAYVVYQVVKSPVVRAVFARNVMSYFSGILGYLFIVVFVVVAAILAFNAQFFTANLANLDQLTQSFPLLLLFIVPAITMTVWAEERKQGTDELLFTLPANDVEILIGKYLAVVAVYSVALLFSTGLWAVLEAYSDPGWNMFFSTFLGYWLAGSSLLAVGMFASALTRSATVAFVLGAILCAIPVFLSTSALGLSSGFVKDTIGQNELVAQILEPLTAFSVGEHLHEFSLGVIRLSSVLYFESLAVLFLYLNLILISERHWSRRKKWSMGLQYGFRAASVLVVLVSLYVIVTQTSGRADIDLTRQNYFTLSDATLETIDNIEDDRPVTIQAFLSPEVPTEYVKTKRQLRGLLRQIDQRGGNRIDVRIIDTAKYQPSADEARSFGIEPREVQAEVDGKFVTEDVYMGLVFQSSYDEVVVPFVGRGTPVEYELTRSLRTVSNAHRMTIGILETPVGMMSGNWRIIDELRRQYNVEGVSASQPIEKEKRLFTIEDENLLASLRKSKESEVPEAVRALFEKNQAQLSDDVVLSYDAKTDTATIEDRRIHRTYAIRQIEEEQEEPAEEESEQESSAEEKVDDEADANKDDGESKPGEAGKDKKTEKEEPAEPEYGVFTDRFDVVIAVLPSLLSQDEMDNFVAYIEQGGPSLIFDDPLCYSGGVQGRQGITGEYEEIVVRWSPNLPAQGTPRASYFSLLSALNLQWVPGEIVWDFHNPFPEYEDHPGWKRGFFTVLSQRPVEEDQPLAFNESSEITKGLKRMLLLYSGQVRQQPIEKLEVTPLLRTGTVAGVMNWDKLVSQTVSFNPLSRQPSQAFELLPLQDTLPAIDRSKLSEKDQQELLANTLFQADGRSHIVAAHIQPKEGSDLKTHAVFVADMDLISDFFFNLREGQFLNMELDNVSFVLNAVDVLAGENSFLDLRRRKAPQPSLTKIEKQKEGLRRQERAAVNEAKTELLKEQIKLAEAVKKLEEEFRNSEASSVSEAAQQYQEMAMSVTAEVQRLEKRQEELQEELDRKRKEAKTEYERGVKEIENEIRLKAIVLPAIPAIAMGLIFLSVRLISERREIAPDRRR